MTDSTTILTLTQWEYDVMIAENKRLRDALALATEALAQREEELAAERRKNRELSLAIGSAREAAGDAAVVVCRVCDALPETTL